MTDGAMVTNEQRRENGLVTRENIGGTLNIFDTGSGNNVGSLTLFDYRV